MKEATKEDIIREMPLFRISKGEEEILLRAKKYLSKDAYRGTKYLCYAILRNDYSLNYPLRYKIEESIFPCLNLWSYLQGRLYIDGVITHKDLYSEVDQYELRRIWVDKIISYNKSLREDGV